MTIFILALAMLFMFYLAIMQFRDRKRASRLKPIPLKIESPDTTQRRRR